MIFNTLKIGIFFLWNTRVNVHANIEKLRFLLLLKIDCYEEIDDRTFLKILTRPACPATDAPAEHLSAVLHIEPASVMQRF